ncbi:MAG: LamG domain-containing protein, partial [Planctomycetes bacterium]|nr:LamG domain-containing protein [Planctomycetota bacterium]
AMATVSPGGDLAWAPQPFRFEAGASLRHIDFANGSDDGDGSRARPWKHHPWDAEATGAAKACAGIHTYIFKRGVTYRGRLQPRESGAAGDPIRLTSDPAWGDGEAVLSGAEAVSGWKRGAELAGLPDAGRVWWADVPFKPKNLWIAGTQGSLRIPLARTPNWTASDPNDPMSEWWTLEQPEWWTGKWKISYKGHRAHMGVDRKNLTAPADTYVGAIIRPEFAIVMGTPFPTRVEGFDEQQKGLIFQGIWTGDSEQHWTGNRYYLEDKPQFLDSDGEFWAEARGDGARVYLRLPGGGDPNAVRIEAGRHISIIEAEGLSEVAISGLGFRYTNTHWDLSQPGWGHADVANAAIRVRGSCTGLSVRNCRFDHIAGKALLVDARKPEQAFDRLAFDDNDLEAIDHGAMLLECGGRGDVEILRNRMHEIGARPHRQDWGHAMVVNCPQFMHIAGNVMTRLYGAGIFVFGGKGSGDAREVALSRSLIHGNKVVDSLLAANDWGGIETWQCGPHYVYNNISGAAHGYWNCTVKPGEKRGFCLGFNYYFDGSFRNALFNNIAWGVTSDRTSKHFSHAAFYEAVPTTHNLFLNNTAQDFQMFSNWSPAGGRHWMLGNLLMNIQGPVFQWGKLKEDKGEQPAAYPHENTAISRNLLWNCGEAGKPFGIFEADGKGHADLAAMAAAMAARKAMAGDVGTTAGTVPVIDAGPARDYAPAAGSPAIDGGVKAFVPWTIARTVGEWHFRRNQADPTVVLDDHWHPAAYLVEREDYHRSPQYPLRGVGIAAVDFIAGPLEDWVDGALRLDGKGQHLVLAQAAMAAPYAYEVPVKGGKKERRVAQGADLATPDIDRHNLLIEGYIRPDAGQGAAVIAAKLAGSGYQLALNRAGGVTLTLVSGGATAALASGARIADGAWHHVVAEVDRAAGTMAIYTDGVRTAAGPLALPADAGLANTADLVVGQGFAGSFEYLRIARATLADSRTTIEELYDWQFDGPFLRDFAGAVVRGARRDAGAVEAR